MAVNRAHAQVTLDLQLAVAARSAPAPAFFQRVADAAIAEHEIDAELTLRIVGRREARALNRRYRAIDKPTNVLAFAADGLEEIAPHLLGDIVICAPVVSDEARAQGKRRQAHFAHLLVHGVLHLLGYDHQQPRDAARMEARERVILAELGFADPYAA